MKVPSNEENGEPSASKKPNRMRLLGVGLLVPAILFWVAAPAVVFFPLSAGQKIWAGSAFLVLGKGPSGSRPWRSDAR